MNQLEDLRSKGARGLLIVCWLSVLVTLGGLPFAQTGLAPVVAAVLITIVPTLLVLGGGNGAQARMTLGITLPLYPAILLWQWSGREWMLDLHMIFFAAIAMLAILADWRPILAAAAITAAHHLLTNFVAPTLVFPNGGELGRVILHAVVVVLETAVLVMIAARLETLILEQAAAHAERERVQEAAARERARAADAQRVVIEQIGEGLRSLASGDLSLRLAREFPESYEDLRGFFNAAANDLDAIVQSVSEAARQIETGSREISIATDDLAQRTEQQASTLEDIANTLRQLNITVQDNATSARTLQGNAARARDDAQAGTAVVNNAVSAMGQIEQSAHEIAQIVALIDGIAFQTNLLALNAAIEAGRAGEAGKGFAVVANQVRALAQRSGDAANRIKGLIDTSSRQVSQGVKLVGQSGETLETIVTDISEIDGAVARIVQVCEEQANEIGRISERVGNLDSATQHNAAMVEEGTAAARHLSEEAQTMARIVAHFRVSGGRSEKSVDLSTGGNRRVA
ncbi:methyl-accepting chemotaxis protein [Novosphingobium sp. BL-8H]|uniref:methyl-accepting chemotaxis protein n=1 Tax=Novosphingobium sp. BL-8H TaxID=3127640 RepID=UPI003756B187